MSQVGTILGHLNFRKIEGFDPDRIPSGILSKWTVVVEEGHRFAQDPNLATLVIEARKFIRKLIVVCTDWRLFEGRAQIMKPIPWEPKGR